MRLPPLNSLKAFEAASRHMSFQKAAEELHVTASALSYQIKTLEEHLGVTLFVRGNRKVDLTREGKLIQPGIAEAFQQLHRTVSQLEADTPDNVIVVSCGPAQAAKILAPRLYRFADEHPDLELRVSASLALTDFVSDDVDVAIRFGTGNYPGLHMEKLFQEYLTPLVAPRLLEEKGPLETLDDLQKFAFLHDDSFKLLGKQIGWENWLQQAGHPYNPKQELRFSHADHSLEAAISGAGILMGRRELAREDVSRGLLVQPFEQLLDTGYATYFVCPPAHMVRPKNQKFRDWLFRELQCSAS